MTTQQYPEPTVGALIFNLAGDLLLIRSHKWHDRYVVPGGHVELGETLEQALHREVLEETGLGVHDVQFIMTQEFIFDEAFWEKRHFIFFDYACQTNTTEVTLNSEAQEYVWVAPGEALDLLMDKYTRRTIEAYLEREE